MRAAHGADDVVDDGGELAFGPQIGVEPRERVARRQLAVQQQVARLLERRALRQVVNRISAVQQLARAAVDEAHARAVEIDAFQAAMDVDLLGGFRHASPSSVQPPMKRRKPSGSFVMATDTM
jgi:hypothetical protein